MSNPDESLREGVQAPLTPDDAEQVNTSTDNDAGQTDAPGKSDVPESQDPNPSPFQQGFPEQGGGEHSDEVRDGETLAMFADRHRVPVNVIREANADSVDANGELLANTTRLVVP